MHHKTSKEVDIPDIRHSIPIAAKRETVYPLVATAKGFREWWAEDVNESGGAVGLGFFNKTTVYRLRLIESRPPAQAEWACETGDEWNGTRISFTLEVSKAGIVPALHARRLAIRHRVFCIV